MNHEIEVRGASVDEAIADGLRKLRRSKNEVNIEVVDEGRRAILGIGGRDAVVRLSPKTDEPEVKPEPKPVVKPTQPKVQEQKPEPAAEIEEKEQETTSPGDEEEDIPEEGTDQEESELAREIVAQLIELMEVKATVELSETEPDDLTGKKLPLININGDDLGVLIGSRGETLDALQYISRLMVGHKLRQRASFVIDVEGYRQRREQALSRLAERMANKAVKRGSPVTLEAMPAYERRIIHMALRDSEDVRTESTGEGDRRRVRIYPNS